MDENAQELAGFIVDGVKRMSTLLDDLLSFTSVSFSAPKDRFDLKHALEQALKNLDHAIRESGASIVSDGLPVVQGNEGQLIEVFQNLIANAVKYRSKAPIEVRVSAQQCGREWAVEVKDNG